MQSKTDKKYNINKRMSAGIRQSLKQNKIGKGRRKWEYFVDYTILDLMVHLESQFTEGMNWEKLLAGKIHIDHIIPRSYFEFESTEDEEFKKCWALENLQPLWAEDNIKKGNRYVG